MVLPAVIRARVDMVSFCDMWKGNAKELSAGFRRTTNNRMELMAVIAGLEALKKNNVPLKIYSDSQYVVNLLTKGWLKNWMATDFKGGKKKQSRHAGLVVPDLVVVGHILIENRADNRNHPGMSNPGAVISRPTLRAFSCRTRCMALPFATASFRIGICAAIPPMA